MGNRGVVLGKAVAMKAETHTAASPAGMRQELRMKCTRQRCQQALSTLAPDRHLL